MKIKKGELNYDQSGRAYPDNPRVKENWDSIWEYQGKYYKLVGDDEHKEWDEVNIYNQIIDEVFINYCQTKIEKTSTGEIWTSYAGHYGNISKEEFINKCKTDSEFSERWGLKIEERELSDKERVAIFMENKRTNKFEDNNCDIPTKLITITYNNEKIIESYE